MESKSSTSELRTKISQVPRKERQPLYNFFKKNQFPDKNDRKKLAKELRIQSSAITAWFVNTRGDIQRRAKSRLERDEEIKPARGNKKREKNPCDLPLSTLPIQVERAKEIKTSISDIQHECRSVKTEILERLKEIQELKDLSLIRIMDAARKETKEAEKTRDKFNERRRRATRLLLEKERLIKELKKKKKVTWEISASKNKKIRKAEGLQSPAATNRKPSAVKGPTPAPTKVFVQDFKKSTTNRIPSAVKGPTPAPTKMSRSEHAVVDDAGEDDGREKKKGAQDEEASACR